MKTMHNVLLSVLLFAFGFFVVHDYVIADVDADTQYELCYAQGDTAVLDLPTKIHEHIHILLSIPESEASAPGPMPQHAPVVGHADFPRSYISSIRPRPPLS